jgi:predicted Rossmann-fold nucleotide-binding protein
VRLIISGGRDYTNKAFIWFVLDYIHAERGITLLIEGGARGVDRLGREWAIDRGIPYHTEPADWDKFQKAAGAIRNRAMLKIEGVDGVVAFPGGKGTRDMVKATRQAKIPVYLPSNNFKPED